jgi:hypothetical protein
MALQHDSQGFLIGDIIPDIRRANNTLSAIKKDIAEIKRAVLSNASTGGPNLNQRSSRARSVGESGDNTAQPRPRGERRSDSQSRQSGSNNASGPDGGSASPRRRRTANPSPESANPPILPPTSNQSVGDNSPQEANSSILPPVDNQPAGNNQQAANPPVPPTDSDQARIQPEPAPRARDGRGRFEPNREAAQPGQARRDRDNRGRFTSNHDEADQERKQRRLFGDMADRMAEAVTGSAGGLEEIDPTVKAFNEVAQPLARGYQLLAGGDKDERWYRKLFGELRLFRRDQTVFNRAEQRALREIDENTEQAGSGGNAGGSSFLGGLLGGGVSGVAGRLLPLLMTGLSVIFGPIGLVLAGAATAAWGLFTEDGRQFFATAGEKIAAVWSRLSDSFMVGWEDIKSRITEKWDEGIKFFTDLWDPIAKFFADKFGIVSDTAKTVVNKVSETAQQANDFVKDKTGIDVKAGVKSAAESTKSAYQTAKEVARENVIAPAQKAFSSAKDWVLGQTSKLFESGKGGAGTVSTGKGDFGGASYGTYQLSSKQGTLQNFLKSSSYGAQFEGLAPGTKEFNRRWKDVAKNDPAFGAAQHEFIKRTHFDPQAERLKNAGIDINGRGKAVQDAVWSTSVQFGGETSLIEKALKGKDASKLSDAEFVSAIQDYKVANNDRLFSSSSNRVREGTLNRANNEKAQLLSLASIESRMVPSVQMPSVQTASAPAPIVPMMPKPQAIPDAPVVPMPMASDSSRKGLSISIDKGDVGQDISDRRLALLVTGGLSG